MEKFFNSVLARTKAILLLMEDQNLEQSRGFVK